MDLPKNEQQTLLSLITNESAFKSNELAVYKKRLSKRGIIKQAGNKEVRFSLPRFEVFLENIIKFEY